MRAVADKHRRIPPLSLIGLVDDFSSADVSKWTFSGAAHVSANACHFPFPVNSIASDGQLTSVYDYNLVGKAFYFKVVTLPNSGAGGHFRAVIQEMPSGGYAQIILNDAGGFTLQLNNDAGSQIYSLNGTYNHVSMLWLRIRVSVDATTIYWEGSPDASMWSMLGSYALTATTLTNVQIYFRGESWSSNAAPGEVAITYFDCTGPLPPPGVTVSDIDGGPNYYTNNGFTYAAANGWDNSNHFLLGTWLDSILSQADCNRWLDLGYNTAFGLQGGTSGSTYLSLLRTNGFSVVLQSEANYLLDPRWGTPGSETVGILCYDEPGAYSQVANPIENIPDAVSSGRFFWTNFTHDFLVAGLSAFGGIPPSQWIFATVPTPGAVQRRACDIASSDAYWFAGGHPASHNLGAGFSGTGENFFAASSPLTETQMCHGTWYGLQVDRMRVITGGAVPTLVCVETGGPYGEDTLASDYIRPPEINAAVWGAIIHGARGIVYFNATFAGPAPSFNNLNNAYFETVQPYPTGNTVTIYNQVKATNAAVTALAPVINSQTTNNYVSVSPAPNTPLDSLTPSGIDTMVKHYGGNYYIFAMNRGNTSVTATFTVPAGSLTTATVLNESRTCPIASGVFTDNFVDNNAVHIYKLS